MCIKPFLKEICDQDRNNVISAYEWCKCFEKTDRPCAAVRHRLSEDLIATAYAPACDADGFYRPTQCHNSVGICWCVDKHGVEFANTRTRDKPNCGKRNTQLPKQTTKQIFLYPQQQTKLLTTMIARRRRTMKKLVLTESFFK